MARLTKFDTEALRYVRNLPRSRVDRALRWSVELRITTCHGWSGCGAGFASGPLSACCAARTGRCGQFQCTGQAPSRSPPAKARRVARLAAAYRPRSSAFPSGHSVSAAAFVTAVTMEFPAAAAVVAPLAAAVAYSRVHTGVHWASDVFGGLVLGSGIALTTWQWWLMQSDPADQVGP